jgi:hypothetical protein
MNIVERIDLLLNEVFDSKANIKMYRHNIGYTFDFAIKGIGYEFFAFSNSISPTHYPGTNTTDDEIEYWTIEFGLSGHHDYSKAFGITGTGNAALVFSATAKCFEMFVNKEKPKIVVFSADEPSRIRLYDRFAKMITSKLPYKLSKDENLAYEIGVMGSKVYIFVRR